MSFHNVHLLAQLGYKFESLYVSRIRVLVVTEINGKQPYQYHRPRHPFCR